MKVYSSI